MSRLTEAASGVYVISVTPFTDGGGIDWESLDRVTDFYLEAGADGLTILGMMGEAPKLTPDEAAEVARRVIGRAGVPVVVGVSAPGLAALRDLSATVMDMGAAGVMVAPPGTLRTDPQIHGYYGQVVRAVGEETPVVLQDFPLSTNVQISDEVLGRIIDDYPSLVMLKHEDWPGLAKISRVREAEAAGRRRISILCGNGGSFLVEELARGADGAMTGFGYPEMMVEICRLHGKGRTGSGAGHLRRLPAAHPLRDAAGARARGPQARSGAAWRDCVSRCAATRRDARWSNGCRGRPIDGAAGTAARRTGLKRSVSRRRRSRNRGFSMRPFSCRLGRRQPLEVS